MAGGGRRTAPTAENSHHRPPGGHSKGRYQNRPDNKIRAEKNKQWPFFQEKAVVAFRVYGVKTALPLFGKMAGKEADMALHNAKTYPPLPKGGDRI